MSAVAPEEQTMVRGIQRIGKAPPRLDANLIAMGAVLTAGPDSYILNPLGISCQNIVCGSPSIVYQSMSRKGIEFLDKKKCCGQRHYQISKMTGMIALGMQDTKAVIGRTRNYKLGTCASGPYYGVTTDDHSDLRISLQNDAGILKCCAPLCSGPPGGNQCKNCNQLLKGNLIRNVHQPLFDGESKKKERVQIGIITHSYLLFPTGCCSAAPFKFLHMRVEITNEEWKAAATEDDYIRLSAFLMTTNGGEFKFVDNFLGDGLGRLGQTWAAGNGSDFGLNQWETFSDVKGMLANGVINSGSLLDEIAAMIKGGIAAAKSTMNAGMDKAKAGMDKLGDKMNQLSGGEFV
jgi:hypothetical protein